MKKLTLTIFSLIFPLFLFAQVCTPDPQYTNPGIFPDSSVNIAPTCVGETYSQVITIIIDDEIQGFSVNKVTLTNVMGLPGNFTYQCEPANCEFLPNTPYCILVTGTATSNDVGAHSISFEVEAEVDFLGSPITQSETIDDFYTLIVNDNPVADAGADVSIAAGNDTQIGGQPVASGGTAPYIYNWSPSASLNDPSIENPTANPTQTTTYTVTVTDSNGCFSTDQVTVEVQGTISVDAGPDVDACEGDEVTLGVENPVSGGTEPFDYTWTDPDGNVVGNDATLTLTANTTIEGTYTLSVEDAGQIQGQDQIELSVSLLPIVTFDAPGPYCKYDVEKPLTGGLPAGGSYVIDQDLISSFNPSEISGTEVEVTYVYTEGICTNQATATIELNELPQVNAGEDTIISSTELTGQIELQGSGDGTFSWSPADLLDDPTIANPTATIDTTIVFTLEVTDGNGCVNTDEVTVLFETEVFANTLSMPSLDIDVYPNPVHSELVIEHQSEKSVLAEIQFFDLNGRLLKTRNADLINVQKFDLSEFTSGIYFLKIESENSVNTYRVVRQ